MSAQLFLTTEAVGAKEIRRATGVRHTVKEAQRTPLAVIVVLTRPVSHTMFLVHRWLGVELLFLLHDPPLATGTTPYASTFKAGL
jgi:hypothetical protein